MEETNLAFTEPEANTKKGLTGSTLKFIAIATMLVDHTAASLIENHMDFSNLNMNLYALDFILRIFIGRLGFPLFVFLMVEGSQHTRNKIKYLRNMLIFAILSEVPFDLALVSGTVWDYSHQNVFFTLFLGLSFIFLSDYVKNKENPNGYLKFMGHLGSLFAGCVAAQAIYDSSISANVSGTVAYLMEYAGKSVGNIEKYITIGLSLEAFLITAIIYLFKSMKFDENKRIYVANSLFFLCITMGIADLLNTDYSAWGVLVIAIMYAFKDKKVKEAALGCLGLSIMQFIEATSFLILIPVSMYNGKRGLKLKYFFYFFYPVHLTLLWLLGLLIY